MHGIFPIIGYHDREEFTLKIKQILSQTRRDYVALMECEHCGHEQKDLHGYDDANFHNNVIPNMECPGCKKKSKNNFVKGRKNDG